MGDLLLARHGATAWALDGRHTGLTDLPLLPEGEQAARELAPRFAARTLAAAFCSPLLRARRTAELAGLDAELEPDLLEWDNGEYEGRRTEEIRQERPDWWLWTDGAPGGEDWPQVQDRCVRVLDRVRPLLASGDVALVGHGHALRALAAVWVGLPAHKGGIFTMEPARLSVLGTYRGHPVVREWDVP